MRKSVYVETSVVSYLSARPSRNIIVAAWQQETRQWWETQRRRFDLFISELVLTEAAGGDSDCAKRRLEELHGIPVLELTGAVGIVAKELVRKGALPPEALDDATHVAVAAVHGVDYLLTWNCRHLDNAELKPLVRSVCAIAGYRCPEICTPQELMGAHEHDG
jgi:predicted nucleic acid-binding protein